MATRPTVSADHAMRAREILNTLDSMTLEKTKAPMPVPEVMAFHAECQVAATAALAHATLAVAGRGAHRERTSGPEPMRKLLRTLAEINELPIDSVIRWTRPFEGGLLPWVAEKIDASTGAEWIITGEDTPKNPDETWLPATLLYRGTS